jgi:hypothetical protein
VPWYYPAESHSLTKPEKHYSASGSRRIPRTGTFHHCDMEPTLVLTRSMLLFSCHVNSDMDTARKCVQHMKIMSCYSLHANKTNNVLINKINNTNLVTNSWGRSFRINYSLFSDICDSHGRRMKIALMMEAAKTSETSVKSYENTRREPQKVVIFQFLIFSSQVHKEHLQFMTCLTHIAYDLHYKSRDEVINTPPSYFEHRAFTIRTGDPTNPD